MNGREREDFIADMIRLVDRKLAEHGYPPGAPDRGLAPVSVWERMPRVHVGVVLRRRSPWRYLLAALFGAFALVGWRRSR